MQCLQPYDESDVELEFVTKDSHGMARLPAMGAFGWRIQSGGARRVVLRDFSSNCSNCSAGSGGLRK